MTGKGENHGWRGSGRFRVARLDGRLVLSFGAISTKRTRPNAEIGAFFRKDYRALRPAYGGFRVTIYVECENPHRRIDADNVAKACLDALTGIVWHDDSQVQHLAVDKVAADRDRVTVVIEPAGKACASAELRALTNALEGLP